MKFIQKTLKNKLNVLLVPIQDSQSVVVTIYVKVGSRYEQENVAGVAHFLEHIFFKGSEAHPKPTDISRIVDSIGGDFNAATGKEYTEFYIHAAKDRFDLIFDILTDMLQRPLFDAAEIEREKGVVREEMNMYDDSPKSQVESILDRTMWPKSQFGADIIGTHKTVQGLIREQVLGFKELYYQPGNMVIGIGGAFNSQKVLSKIEKTWGKLSNRRTPGYEPALIAGEAVQKSPRTKVKFKDTKQAHLALGFKSFAHGDPRNPAVGVLSSILGSGMSSRLFVKVREENGLAYYVYSSNSLYGDTGSFGVFAGLKIEKTGDALAAIVAELEKLKSEPVTAEELRKAKDFAKGRIALHLEGVHEQLDWVIDRFATRGKVELPAEYLARIEKVTAAQVQAAARQIFTKSNASLSIVGPYRSGEKFAKLLKFSS